MSQPDTEQPTPSLPPALGQDKDKYQSPPPPPSNFTPPPSSKTAAPQTSYTQARTPTPTHSHLSSPPLTIRTPPPNRQRSSSGSDGPGHFLESLEATASVEELRSLLHNTEAEYRSANASAAHHRLQYELLTMEYSEAVKRFQVELDMAKKEVEVLQQATLLSHVKSNAPLSAPAASYTTVSSVPASNLTILDLQNHVRALDTENQSLRVRLADAKAIILERESALSAENDRLRQRIRENREHMTRMRQNNVLFGEQQQQPSSKQTNGKTTLSAPYTPSRQPYAGRYGTSVNTPGNDEPFAALLLADQVLSQEAASTPSTPVNSQQRRHQSSHFRGAHSMTSLPSTPYRSTAIESSTPQSKPSAYPPHFSSSPIYSNKTPDGRQQQQQHASDPRQRRRDSRDSTISASDAEDRDPEPDRVLDSEPESNDRNQDVYSSQASQEAANMLRKSSSSFQRYQSSSKEAAPTSATPTKKFQSKLYGYQVTKPSASAAPTSGRDGESTPKKRRYEQDEASKSQTSKKLRAGVAAEGVGLGIGGWTGH